MLGSVYVMTVFPLAPPTSNSRFASDLVYGKPPRPIAFPAVEPPEEEVSETKRHLENRTALYLVLMELFASDSSIGSEQFVYFDETNPKRCLSPDAFVKRNVSDELFSVWKTWERGAPDLGVEIISDSDARDVDWKDKLSRYRAAGFQEVVRYDVESKTSPIRVWDSIHGDLVERAADDPNRHFCRTLGLWWLSLKDAEYGPMLRLARDREGNDVLPTPSEARVEEVMAHQKTKQALAAAEREAQDAKARAEQAEQELLQLKAALARQAR